MTSRERLLRCLRHQEVDRIPIAPFLYYNNIYEMFDYVPRIDNFFDPGDFDPIVHFLDYCDRFGFDALHTLGSVWDQYTLDKPGENWDVKVTIEDSNGEVRKTVEVATPGGKLRQVENLRHSSSHLVVSAIEEYFIKTPKDFETLAQYAPPAEEIDCQLVRRSRACIGDHGLSVACTHGAFNTVNMFRKLDDLMVDPLSDEGFYRAMIEYFTERTLRQDCKILGEGADVIEMGGNMATSGVGPKFFQKYVLEYENRVAKAIHAAGGFVIYHNCGDAAKIMYLYNGMEIDVLGYLTPPPFGDVNLDKALEVMRPDLILRGNIDQVEFLVKATPAEIRERVREVLGKAKPRGNWILSTTDFFFDGCPYENIQAFADAGREFGAY